MKIKDFRNTFLTGLAVLLPIVVTGWIIWWFISSAETFLAWQLNFILPKSAYVPGMGLVAALLVIFFIGLMMRTWLVSNLVNFGENLLRRIPLVNTLYGSIRDFARFVSADPQQRFNRVVSITLPGTEMQLIGFVTREDFENLPAELYQHDTIAVYLPLSYQIGGYTILLPRRLTNPVDMSMEDALRFSITAGMSGSPTK